MLGGILPDPSTHPSGHREDVPSTSESGRGLQIIDTLATSWGTTHLDAGKHVWFQLDTREWAFSPGCRCGVAGIESTELQSGHRVVPNPGPWDAN